MHIPLALGHVGAVPPLHMKSDSPVPQPVVGMGKLKLEGDACQDMAHCVVLCFLTEDSADDAKCSQ